MYVYCDESSQTAARYMVLGALFVEEDARTKLEQAFRGIRGTQLANATMKWEKVSDKYFSEYEQSALLIAKRGRVGMLEYHAMTLDTTKFDHDTYNAGDDELGYYKFFFNLLKWRMIRHKGAVFYVTMDRRHNRKADRLEELKWYLNQHLVTYWSYEPVKSIVARSCKEVLLLQITDILTGAVAYHANKRDNKPDARRAKVKLAQALARGFGLPRLDVDMGSHTFYSVWHFRLEPPRRRTETG